MNIVTTVLVIISLLAGGGGAVYASADSQPGDVLYPVKMAVEVVRLTASLNDASNAELHVAFAAERLEEIAGLLEEGHPDPEAIKQALTSYVTHVESILSLSNEDSGLSPEEREALVESLAQHEEQLMALLDQVSAEARPALELALELIGGSPGRPEELPATMPEDVPAGPPESRPELPPEVPEDVPAGPPESRPELPPRCQRMPLSVPLRASQSCPPRYQRTSRSRHQRPYLPSHPLMCLLSHQPLPHYPPKMRAARALAAAAGDVPKFTKLRVNQTMGLAWASPIVL